MWTIKYHPEAQKDLYKLDGSTVKTVLKGILKVAENPLSQSQGGYGKPLGNKGGINLTNLFKIKFKRIGIRVVYKLLSDELTQEMYILVIAARADSEDEQYLPAELATAR